MNEKERIKLEDLINELEQYRGRHTELISIYAPAGSNINHISNQVEQEKGTASNIKSKSTRKNVMDALERITRHLKLFKQIPANGLAVFAGNISENEGQPKIEVWSIEPPFELKVKMYRCDQRFMLEPLKEMLKAKEVYGLVVIDRKEATLGILEGKSIRMLRHMTSGAPGKMKAGGQCLSQDTLIMKDNGEIIEIKDSHNPLMVMSENFNMEKTEKTPLVYKWENKKKLFRISTLYPKIEIKSSEDHYFFVRTDNGIEEKPLSEIKENDYLIMPEKINLDLEDQKIDFSPKITRESTIKKVCVPSKINPDIARLLGYYLGDGSYEIDRATFFEQRKEVAEYYKKLLENTFKINADLRFRKSKNYYQIRVYSRIISQLFNSIFNAKDKTLNERMPSIILKSSDKSLASFLSGFFDAEGYVSSRIGLGINNKILARQIQLSLLRLGIISSLAGYNNRRNPYSSKIRYTIEINDTKSMKTFCDVIRFSSDEKNEKLLRIINRRGDRDKIRQLVVNGKEVYRIIKNAGLKTSIFRSSGFFGNRRQLNKELFKKNIINKIKDDDLKRRLEMFYNSNLIAVKISNIRKIDEETTIDIETKNHNFLANGLIVHNSAQRFKRLTEEIIKEFYRRVADAIKVEFFDNPKLEGILIGGPGPTKEDFLKEGEIITSLQKKIVAVKDIGYSDVSGLKALVDVSQDVLAKEEITKETEILKKFFMMLGKNPEMIAYKKDDVNKALEMGAVDTLLISKDIKREDARELEEKAANIDAKITFISTETEEGIQFRNIGGLGAFLRFRIG